MSTIASKAGYGRYGRYGSCYKCCYKCCYNAARLLRISHDDTVQ
jgi:hypothetical protein